MTKLCHRCKTEKPLEAFHRDTHAPDGLAYWCKICRREYRHTPTQKQYHLDYSKTPSCRKRQAQWHFEKTYGLSIGAYEALLKGQNHRCGICQNPILPVGQGRNRDRACVDHDHATGAVRGLLCDRCNRSLGGFLDDPILLRKAADYLDQH